MTATGTAGPSPWDLWEPRLAALCDGIRACTWESLGSAVRDGALERLTRVTGTGAGDVTFGLDLPSEEHIDSWLDLHAREEPLSLLTEDRGWRHRGPGPGGSPRDLDGFDHGGPRIAIDPIDGTRNLMSDLRSAWTVVSFAGPGPSQPGFGDLGGGMVSELPVSRAAAFRRFRAARGGPCLVEELTTAGELSSRTELAVDDDDRVDQGYFPFFRYAPEHRPDLARLEAAFFARLAQHEGAEVDTCWDDQYISNAGQLVLLATGVYRMVVDARALVARRRDVRTTTSKPYDVAGAMVVAQAAGARLTAADGSALDFPIDATTPIDFAGYANAATQGRLEPHWREVVRGG